MALSFLVVIGICSGGDDALQPNGSCELSCLLNGFCFLVYLVANTVTSKDREPAGWQDFGKLKMW